MLLLNFFSYRSLSILSIITAPSISPQMDYNSVPHVVAVIHVLLQTWRILSPILAESKSTEPAIEQRYLLIKRHRKDYNYIKDFCEYRPFCSTNIDNPMFVFTSGYSAAISSRK
jgi:hypothetical protein